VLRFCGRLLFLVFQTLIHCYIIELRRYDFILNAANILCAFWQQCRFSIWRTSFPDPIRHIARLCRLRAAKIFRGQNVLVSILNYKNRNNGWYVRCHHFVNRTVQIMLCTKRQKIVWFVPPLVYINRKRSQKMSNKFVWWGKKAAWGQLPPCPLLATCLDPYQEYLLQKQTVAFKSVYFAFYIAYLNGPLVGHNIFWGHGATL